MTDANTMSENEFLQWWYEEDDKWMLKIYALADDPKEKAEIARIWMEDRLSRNLEV